MKNLGMRRYIKTLLALVFLLGVGTGYCNAGTYTSKESPQHTVQYEEASGVYVTAGQCKDYSRQNHPLNVVRCRAMLSNHFYLNGEIVDDRMDEMAKTSVSFPSVSDDLLFTVLSVLGILILIGLAFYIYLIPTFVAYNRQHPQRVFIMLLNLFLGNTLVGWIAALIWARSGEENKNARDDRSGNKWGG